MNKHQQIAIKALEQMLKMQELYGESDKTKNACLEAIEWVKSQKEE